jgi:UDP-N-acetyl-D-mannosaminuronate dehydrogenase
VVLGASYRGRVKEAAFSGVFPVVAALSAAGAEVSVHDPMYSADELEKLGLVPHQLGEPAEAAVLQADHDEYRTLGAADLPGVRVLVDGRDITDPGRWGGVTRIVIGQATNRL